MFHGYYGKNSTTYRKPWLASVFSPGQGERESEGPGGDHGFVS